MKIAFYDTHSFELPVILEANKKFQFEISHYDYRLTEATVAMAKGFDVVSCFTHDQLSAPVLQKLKEGGTKLVALRCAGFNHVDINAAAANGILVVRVPAYSPYSVAEHAVGLILSLNRKICRASNRVRDLNFSLDGLVGFDLFGKTVGVIGAGKIGSVFAKIMHGFGCKILICDQSKRKELLELENVQYVDLDFLYQNADIISLHLPLTQSSHHLLNAAAFEKMKKGVMLINTGRGGLIDAKALIKALKSGHIGAAGLDVYEEEENIFFQNLSGLILQDDVLARLLSFPNVLITAHQAFLTKEAIHGIVETNFMNVKEFMEKKPLTNEVKV